MKKGLFIATSNGYKLREFSDILKDADIEYFTIEQCPMDDVDETGTTLRENASLKARAGHKASGMVSIGEDSGLFIDLLNGAPGVFSARYLSEESTYDEKIDDIIKRLKEFPDQTWHARFMTVICVYDGYSDKYFEGVWEGGIIPTPSGSNGFAYDTIFYDPWEQMTAADMTPLRKSQKSSRGRAIRKMLPYLKIVSKGVNYPQQFADYAKGLAYEWATDDRKTAEIDTGEYTDVQFRARGMIHGILAAIDGKVDGMPAYTLREEPELPSSYTYDALIGNMSGDLSRNMYGHGYRSDDPMIKDLIDTIHRNIEYWISGDNYGGSDTQEDTPENIINGVLFSFMINIDSNYRLCPVVDGVELNDISGILHNL